MQIDLHTPDLSPVVLAPGEGRTLWVGGFPHTIKLDAAQTGGTFSVIDCVVPVGGGPPPHRHSHEAEAFYVLDGTFEFFCDGETFTAGAGSFVYLPVGTVHTWRAVGETDGRVIGIIAPGGFERFFDEVGEPFVAGAPAPPFGEAEIGRMISTAPAYGLSLHPDAVPAS